MCKIALRQSTDGDAAFINALTRRVMREYVESTWESAADREGYYILNKFNQPSTKIIQYHGEDIGHITLTYASNTIVLEGIHILESFQNKGIGGHLLTELIQQAAQEHKILYLVLLKVNLVKDLYERIGLHIYKEDAHRYYMRTAG